MCKAPFFSIILPTFNVEETIESCLKSILNQTFLGYEIIIQDGLSTDATLHKAREFNIDKIQVFEEKDLGVYDAMNKAIEHSKGRYLFFLGSDDVLYNDNVLASIAKTLATSQTDFLYGNVQLTSDKSIVDGPYSKLKLFTEKNICHQGIFYKKNIFKFIGKFNLDYKIWGDWDLNIRCFSHPEFTIKYTNTTIAVYNDVSGVSSLPDREFLKLLPLNSKYSDIRSRIDELEKHLTFSDLIKIGFHKIKNIISRQFKSS